MVARLPLRGGAQAAASESPYQVLGIGSSASADELRHAYQRLARLHHPDRKAAAPAATDEAFQRVQRAYDMLRDPELRRRHDAEERAAQMNSAGAAARVLEVDLGDMDYAEGVWRWECQCGDDFELHEAQLAAGIDELHCRSCSLILRPLYRPLQEEAWEEYAATTHVAEHGLLSRHTPVGACER